MTNHFQLDKLFNIIQSFNGNIFGEPIRDYYINYKLLNKNYTDITFDNINIIFHNKNIIKYFIRIISNNYEIYKENNLIDDKYIKYETYILYYNYLADNKYNIKILKLNIFTNNICIYLKNNNIYSLTNDLDCNQLATNDKSLFLIMKDDSLYHNLFYKNNFNNFNVVFNRVLNKRFSIVKKDFKFNNYINNIDAAYNLLKQDWTMDDYYYNNICILFNWKNKDSNNYRLKYSKEDYNKLKSNESCIICGSNFTNDCTVINTICNHNFHWYCNKDKHGLKYWVENHNISCPICRLQDFI